MPNINDVYPSKFLKAYDLKGSSPTVTIARVDVEQLRKRTGGTDTKAVLYFRGKEKGLLLNKTMALSVTAIAGSPLTERWTGVAITLYATTAAFGKDQHDVIRIKAPAPVQMGGNPQPPRRSMPPIFTDDLEIDLADAGVRR
jgi:hypothetical protein